MSPSLAIVPNRPANEGRVETLAERVRRLQTEARNLAREHIASLQTALLSMEAMAADIAGGGEAYPPGVREIASRLVEDCGSRAKTLEAIANRR